MVLIRRLGKYLLLASLPAIMLLVYNNTANWHYHILKDGTITKHAHPYTKDAQHNSPFQKHQHTEIELVILTQLTNILFMLVVFLALGSMINNVIWRTGLFPYHVHIKPVALENISLRGPP